MTGLQIRRRGEYVHLKLPLSSSEASRDAVVIGLLFRFGLSLRFTPGGGDASGDIFVLTFVTCQ